MLTMQCYTARANGRRNTCLTGFHVTLWVEPGRMKTRGRVMTYGVPYGARARMILLYLQTQAVRTGSREVALGRSMRDWMERMGLAVGSETARSLKEQAARISACTLKFFGKTTNTKPGPAARLLPRGFASRCRRTARARFGRIAWSSTKCSGRHSGTIQCRCWRRRSAKRDRSDRLTALDYAQILKALADTHFPAASKIVLVQDNLSTHKPASLYEAFPPAEARRLVERFEWHFTPKHGSWLNMAEIELSACHPNASIGESQHANPGR
jgi:hypothetical protein